jgi:predicted peptidase
MLAAILMTAILSPGHFVSRSPVIDGSSRRFEVWVPRGYTRRRKWPAILFLHGSGERGSDGERQTTVGLGRLLREGKLDPAAVVIFPQCPEDGHWVGPARRIALGALDAAESEFAIDSRRVAITGMSMGGAGTWVLAAENPKRFWRVAPVCGWVRKPPKLADVMQAAAWLAGVTDPYGELASRLPRVPIWIFHGTDDPVVPVAESRRMADVLGVNAGYTEFPGVGHDAWDPAYGATSLVEWLVKDPTSADARHRSGS